MALELHDDYETLEAALALIDEWEVEIGALPSSPAPSSDDGDARSTTTSATTDDSDSSSSPLPPSASSITTTTTTPSVAAPPRRRRARDEETQSDTKHGAQRSRREELVCLRRKVRELETELTRLREATGDALVKSEEPGNRELDATWVWQQIASRQLEHRQRAERENLQLRVQVEEQIKWAKEIMRVLLRAYHQTERGEDEDRHARALKRVKLPQDARTEVTEEDQLRRVDELLAESAAVFAAPPFTGGQPVFRDINLVEHANGEATINVDSSWVVPFPVDQVTSAFWTHLMRKTKTSVCDLSLCNQPDDGREVLVTRYESSASASKFAGKFFGRFVARRTHPTDDKPGIIIMDMCADPVGFAPMSMEGVRLHHETVMRVIWADQAAGEPAPVSVGGRMSLVQMSHRVHVQLAAAETPTRRRRVGAMTDYCMYQAEADLIWKQDVLETLLMRSMISSSSSGT